MRGPEVRKDLYPLADDQPSQGGRRDRPGIHYLSDKQERNYWVRVAKGDGCWDWTGGHNGAGRGIIKLYQIQMLAPRVAYALHFGFNPGWWDVIHTCDDPSCVNPEHLKLGTPQDNTNDMIEKGRFIASHGHTTVYPGTPEEAIMLDLSIPSNKAAEMLGVTSKCVYCRRQKARGHIVAPGGNVKIRRETSEEATMLDLSRRVVDVAAFLGVSSNCVYKRRQQARESAVA